MMNSSLQGTTDGIMATNGGDRLNPPGPNREHIAFYLGSITANSGWLTGFEPATAWTTTRSSTN